MTQGAPWTQAEDTRLSAARTLDVPWDVIVRDYLPGRTEPAAKARFVLLLSKSEREQAGDVPKRPMRSASTGFANVPEPKPQDHLVITTSADRAEALSGCDMLRDRTAALFDREAKRRGTSPQAVRLILNYSPDELRKMASAAQARAA